MIELRLSQSYVSTILYLCAHGASYGSTQARSVIEEFERQGVPIPVWIQHILREEVK